MGKSHSRVGQFSKCQYLLAVKKKQPLSLVEKGTVSLYLHEMDLIGPNIEIDRFHSRIHEPEDSKHILLYSPFPFSFYVS